MSFLCSSVDLQQAVIFIVIYGFYLQVEVPYAIGFTTTVSPNGGETETPRITMHGYLILYFARLIISIFGSFCRSFLKFVLCTF